MDFGRVTRTLPGERCTGLFQKGQAVSHRMLEKKNKIKKKKRIQQNYTNAAEGIYGEAGQRLASPPEVWSPQGGEDAGNACSPALPTKAGGVGVGEGRAKTFKI